MITSYMIFVNQKYYAWLLFISLKFCNWSDRRLFDYQATNQKQILKQLLKQLSKQILKQILKANFESRNLANQKQIF